MMPAGERYLQADSMLAQALDLLLQHPGEISSRDLQRAVLQVTNSKEQAHGLMNRLVKQGLVERRIVLTDAARAIRRTNSKGIP